ncbi:hypothetical protein CONPUDRAFT_154503 [Coniophora puteana RWD-64-598 SS2]|uniref:Uncharacterized protein n=1 Tax=Coniophora puteana (strain RWD-64-598) TaxID=741705 RepID=A0A5M3MMP6_CONPW|nr:uncharacterized protein CONPUDRAFT_154503 [Coniophora puteana RWD-64-598 SS2]EIW80472.1 hypothetical protein CONPUDRAFT_154503 [Coniophora puteana RWD-64-598 SS2]
MSLPAILSLLKALVLAITSLLSPDSFLADVFKTRGTSMKHSCISFISSALTHRRTCISGFSRSRSFATVLIKTTLFVSALIFTFVYLLLFELGISRFAASLATGTQAIPRFEFKGLNMPTNTRTSSSSQDRTAVDWYKSNHEEPMAARDDDDEQEFPSKIGGIAMDDDSRFTRSLHAVSQLSETAPLVQVRKALHETQEEHGALFDAYCAVKDQVRVLYALLPKDKKKSFDRGLSLQSMISESKFKSKGGGFSKCIRPWVADGTFPLSPLARSIDPADPSRFEDAKAMGLGNMADVYRFMGVEEMGDLIEQEETFATTFTQAVDAGCRIYTTALRAAELSIFGPLTVARKLSLLKKKVDSPKYERHAPVLYANPDRLLPQEFLMSEVLVKATIVKFFGLSGLKLRRVRRPRSKAKGTQLTVIDPPMIASSTADVRYLLSNDPTYVNPGLPSGIPYGDDRDYILKLLFTGNAVWTFKVQEYFNYEILGIPPSSSDHPVLKELPAPVDQEKDEDEELMAGLEQYYAPKPPADSESSPPAGASSTNSSHSLSALAKQVRRMELDPQTNSLERPDTAAEVEHQNEEDEDEDEDEDDSEGGDGENKAEYAEQDEDSIPTAYAQDRTRDAAGGLQRTSAYLDIQAKDGKNSSVSARAVGVIREDSISAGHTSKNQGGGTPLDSISTHRALRARGMATRNGTNAGRLEDLDPQADATMAGIKTKGTTAKGKKEGEHRLRGSN